MDRHKKGICFRCGAYMSKKLGKHLAGRNRLALCTGQLGGYYDKNGLRTACYVLVDEDEDGLPASEWKERYYPGDGNHHLYIAFHNVTGEMRFGRTDESNPTNKGRRHINNKCAKNETCYALLEGLTKKACDLAECVFTSCFDLRRTRAKQYENVDHLPAKYTISKAKKRKNSAEIQITWAGPDGEEVSGNPFDEMQVVAMRILRRFFDEHPELLPDFFSDLVEDGPFDSDDADPAVQLINDQLEALDEKRERYLEAWEEERRALKRKAYEIRHGNAKRRRLEEEGSEMSED